MTPEQIGFIVQAGITAAKFISNVVQTIRADLGLTEAQKEEHLKALSAEFPADLLQTKEDAKHVREVDPIKT